LDCAGVNLPDKIKVPLPADLSFLISSRALLAATLASRAKIAFSIIFSAAFLFSSSQ
jgi:hypothetical protein